VSQWPKVLINVASSLDGKINPAPGYRSGRFMMSRHRKDF
jgi:riboflavin biosynthesis pyrimidine reductase